MTNMNDRLKHQKYNQMWIIISFLIIILTNNIFVFANQISAHSPFQLDGTINSYLQFPSWHYFFSASDEQVQSLNLESSFSFEFKCFHSEQWSSLNNTNTRPVGGLLLYTDDQTGLGGIFLEIKLLSETSLRIRIDDSASSSESVRTKNIIELQSLVNFTDDQWHRIELIRQVQPNSLTTVVNDHHETRSEPITLKVDSEVIHKRIELSKETYHNNKRKAKNIRHHGRSVFIGGLPPEYREHYLDHLALPTSAYELHFQGAIRNVLYAAQSGSHSYSSSSSDEKQRLLEDVDLRIQFPITNGGLLPERFVHTNQCIDQRHWCQHGGYCYATQDGVFCDCSITDYEGPYCQKEKSSLEVAFRGQYIGYNHLDLSTSWSFVSTIESFEFSFRTKSANGLILWNGDDDEDYLSIALRNAGLLLTIKLGSAPIQEKVISPSKVRFDDNQWHSVVVSRKIREISPSTHFSHFLITVDGIYTQHGSIAGTIPILSQNFSFNHFIGCLRKIVFISNNVRLDLLDLINVQYNQKQQSIKSVGLVQLYGKHDLTSTNEHYQLPRCQDVDSFDPITFTTSDSYLKLSDGWNSPNEGTLSLKIRTNEPNGVLLYSVGTLNNTHHGNVYDYFALELLDGQLYLLQHLGSLPVKVKSTTKRIDDNYWHTIQVKRTGRNGQVVVDGDIVSDFVSPGTSNNLDLGDSLYLGGYPRFTGNRLTYTPPQLWSTAFGGGYIGCVSDLHLDGRLVDIVALAKKQDSGSIKPSCHSSTQSQCLPNPCQNGGMCIEGWNRYSCECSSTSFTGSVCAKNAATLSFNGEQYLMINLPEEQRTQVESLYIRFRTNKPNGIILITQSSEPHYLAIILESGSIRVDLNYGGVVKEPIVVIGERLNDDQWHTVHVNRRGPSFDIDIDHRWNQTVDLIGKDYTLLVRTIHVGARINKPQTSKTVKSAHVSGFVGYMQNFVFNGHQYFEMTRDGHLTGGSIRMTAKLGKKNRVLHHAVTFKSKYTFIGLPQLKAYSGLNIYFQFKTREPNGLLFFNGGEKGHDFIALELIGGHLHYVFDLGDGPRRLQSKSGNSLNDNHWHTVTLGRPSLYQHTMLIDDTLMTTSTSTNANRNLHLDLDGLLYFGGVRDQMWSSIPKAIRSKHGFEGCIASLDLNGETFNLVGSEVLIPSTLVEAGCSAPINRCSSTACANRGICVQLWNSYTCDCDLTTYSGPTCTDGNGNNRTIASIAYSFGPNPGLVTYTFDDNNRPDTRNDLLAIGFLTTHKNGALLRVDSGTTADYLQLELIDGNILAVYNLGTEDIDIGELGMKVNDGKYHIVRLTRSGQNSTIQIDNHNVFTRSPAGKQMNIFNSHARIEIGGHKNILRGIIEKPFNGIISGLVFNKQHILDMAAEDDPRVKN
ncbi:hypothetical protein RDWZM_009736 [Blomia tropicalis]|uniref:Uncharacterized protein n=1 Tax=Blomia tropicalis TaxID=40697 RepID=A0A9Q0M410_BLOTA|nr:hypothetical protein RDWZM_009736 [Blomia tropicalis]